MSSTVHSYCDVCSFKTETADELCVVYLVNQAALQLALPVSVLVSLEQKNINIVQMFFKLWCRKILNIVLEKY